MLVRSRCRTVLQPARQPGSFGRCRGCGRRGCRGRQATLVALVQPLLHAKRSAQVGGFWLAPAAPALAGQPGEQGRGDGKRHEDLHKCGGEGVSSKRQAASSSLPAPAAAQRWNPWSLLPHACYWTRCGPIWRVQCSRWRPEPCSFQACTTHELPARWGRSFLTQCSETGFEPVLSGHGRINHRCSSRCGFANLLDPAGGAVAARRRPWGRSQAAPVITPPPRQTSPSYTTADWPGVTAHCGCWKSSRHTPPPWAAKRHGASAWR